MLTLGTGVGGGLVLGGKIWQGANGMAGELGHTTVEPNGHPCGCGNRGCLEQYASATAVVRMAREAIANNGASALAQAAGSDPEFSANRSTISPFKATKMRAAFSATSVAAWALCFRRW
jgi:glucokinase